MSPPFTNPYDFEKPVRNPELFAGRQKELAEIDYYLELCRGEKPVFHNLAMIGARAAGKTSLLNVIEHLAKKKGILAVKISLNAESSSNEVILFKEVIDAIMTKGAELGMYEGLGGKIYRQFRKVVDMLDASAEVPLLFGTAYIGVKKNAQSTLSQQVLVHDLKKLWEEAKKYEIPAIALLFDECDLLSKNETLLQKLRNIFSDIDGYMLVFAGTENMFPAISEVFSPIPRFFKRIDVGNFANTEETKECLLKPLAEAEKPLMNLGSVAEIHTITEGNPYEVQLISHYMYKRHKEAGTPQIALDVEVLDNVLNELDRLRKGGAHKVADIVRHSGPDQLRALLATLECPSATIDQLSRFMVLSEIDRHPLEELSNQVSFYDLVIQELVGSGITQDTDGKLAFSGGQFDVLYLKYFALSKGIANFRFGIPDQVDMIAEMMLTHVLLEQLPEYETNVRFDAEMVLPGSRGYRGRKAVFGGKFEIKGARPGEMVTLFSFTPAEMDKRFYLGDPSSIRFRVNISWLKTGFVVQATVKDQSHLTAISQRIDSLKAKLGLLGIEILLKDEIHLTAEGIRLQNEGDFASAHRKYDEALRINPGYELAWANKGLAFFRKQDYENALRCFVKWSEVAPRSNTAWENKGKALIHLKRPGEALESLQRAVDLGPEVWSAWDNRGRALMNVGRFDDAIASFDRAAALKPDDYEAVLFKGFCLSQLGRYDDAIDCYDEVPREHPSHERALYQKAAAFYELNRPDNAFSIIQELSKKNPADHGIMNLKGLILARMGRTQEAIDICGEILAANPNDATLYYNRACFKSKLGESDEALDDLKRAIELNNGLVLEALGESDFQQLRDDPRFKELVSR